MYVMSGLRLSDLNKETTYYLLNTKKKSIQNTNPSQMQITL